MVQNADYRFMSVEQRTQAAFASLLEHELDRRLLVLIHEDGAELRYEKARKRLGEPAKQSFKEAVERLGAHAVINRRLEEHGSRYWSFLSVTERGRNFAKALVGLREKGKIPETIPRMVRDGIQTAFAPTA